MDEKTHDCNCKQCRDISFALDLVKNHKPIEAKMFFSIHPNLSKRHPIARMILERGIVLCKDGIVRIR